MQVFASIGINSYEMEMKIFEFSGKNNMRELDHVRHGIQIGRDVFTMHRISNEKVEEICEVLLDFQRIMQEYGAVDYRVCATSALQEIDNSLLVLDKIRVRTGMRVDVLSNSEHRFLGYKSIASNEEDFQKIIQKGTIVVDVGGGSIQLSIFDKSNLVMTQNLKIGTMRMRERLSDVENRTVNFGYLMEEMISNELKNFKRLYLKDRDIKNVIMVGDYLTYMLGNAEKKSVSREELLQIFQDMRKYTPEEITKATGVPIENVSLLYPSMLIYKQLMEETGAEMAWIPGVNLNDGIAYDYAEKKKIIKAAHNFENDIVESAKHIAKRYQSNKSHIAGTEYLALTIFDKMKNSHGMGKRERLLLQIAVILHDCGKYISMNRTAECSYSIVMATEIIGLSHQEREMVANIVRYNSLDFPSYDSFEKKSSLGKESYLLIGKLTAILRVANAMDRSHKQKFKNVKVTLKEKELTVVVDTAEDITLEQSSFANRIAFFEEIFGIHPILRQKRHL